MTAHHPEKFLLNLSKPVGHGSLWVLLNWNTIPQASWPSVKCNIGTWRASQYNDCSHNFLKIYFLFLFCLFANIIWNLLFKVGPLGCQMGVPCSPSSSLKDCISSTWTLKQKAWAKGEKVKENLAFILFFFSWQLSFPSPFSLTMSPCGPPPDPLIKEHEHLSTSLTAWTLSTQTASCWS